MFYPMVLEESVEDPVGDGDACAVVHGTEINKRNDNTLQDAAAYQLGNTSSREITEVK